MLKTIGIITILFFCADAHVDVDVSSTVKDQSKQIGDAGATADVATTDVQSEGSNKVRSFITCF